MRAPLTFVVLAVVCMTNCAKPTDEDIPASTGGGTGGKGGKGGFSGKGGTGGKGGFGGTTGGSGGFGGVTGGTGGFAATGGIAASGGTSGDSGVEAGDSGNPSGFGPCVTQQDIDSQGQPFEIGFCHNPFACFACPDDAVNPGDIVCSPNCLCVPLPPLCGDDAGTDGSDDGASADADDGGTDADDASD